MKVLYMGFIDIKNDGHIGVRKKIFGQVEAMKNNGMDVEYILHDNKNLMYYSDDERFILSSYKNSIQRRHNMLSMKVINLINQRDIDVVYIRYPISDILFIRFLKKLKKLNKKVYLEIPTYPYDRELKATTLIIDRVFRRNIKKYVDYIITSSGRYENIFGSKCKFIDNCVSTKDITFKTHYYDINKKQINLIAVAFLNNWHGYDRVIEGMREYYSRDTAYYDINFKIVGIGKDYDYLNQLANEYNLRDKIEFVGSKNGNELDKLFENSDIALGSLAIHRKDLKTVSSLKSREYCARGIPFIYAGEDPGFYGKERFLMKVESNDDYINMDNVIEFYNKLTNISDISDIMRAYSKEHFEWDSYYKKF